MTFLDLIRAPRIRFNAEGAGGGAGGAGAGGNDPAAAAAAAAAAGAGGAGGAKWWENGSTFSAEEQQWLAARGLTVDDPAEVLPKLVKGHRAAEQRIGRGLDSILDKPKEGQALTDWMREQKDLFGLPEAPDGYKIERPKDLADSIAWDDAFEGIARQKAYDLGLTPSQMQGMTEIYAGQVKTMLEKADAEVATARSEMMTALQKDWGDQTDAKIARARQAAGVVAEAAGLDSAAIEGISQLLTQKAGGDASTIRLFAAIGEAMAEDKALGLNKGGSLGMTPSEARQKAAQMRSPGGAFYEASSAGKSAEVQRLLPELTRLDKIAAGSM